MLTWAGLGVARVDLNTFSCAPLASILSSHQVLTTSRASSSIASDRALRPVPPICPLTVNYMPTININTCNVFCAHACMQVLLGHGTISQVMVCWLSPTHSSPPYNGGTHTLVLVWTPLPHVKLQADHSVHCPQYPSTA